ncbi:hypothetical protein MRX96_005202 [Rhipicephalus microplus]
MYHGSYTRGNSPTSDYNIDSGRNSPSDLRLGRLLGKHGVTGRKKRDNSDSDSEASLQLVKKKKKGRPPLHQGGVLSGRSTPCKLKADAANKALGLGATRGRLYIKHPEVFKYSGDQEDKQWLYEHNQMPATWRQGGRVVVGHGPVATLRHDDGSASPAEEPLGASPFGQGFEDVSPAASDVSATLEPPLTAPFELVLSP